ncbi:MAG: glycosyltransferase family 9 protein, partial [Elsteraceae bacterium]
VAMESLPAVLGVTMRNVPNEVPYLFPKPDRVAEWGAKLKERAAGKALKVGLVWAGNPSWRLDRFRSPGLSPMLPLLDAPDVAFFGLQVGPARGKIKEYGVEALITDLAGDLSDLTETAAAMANLDLVISSCTGPAHMAAALGRPTWIALNYDACWRWMLDREDSPWYPTVRLFRQSDRGDWAAVFAAIRQALLSFKPA